MEPLMKQESHGGPLGTELSSHSMSLCTPQNFTGKFIYCGEEVDLVTRDAVGMYKCGPCLVALVGLPATGCSKTRGKAREQGTMANTYKLKGALGIAKVIHHVIQPATKCLSS
ncbi:hypothetical protein GH733_019612 [Mirounga leonina]|nr:hypothetical protein GH733_019612 [Mirounga leonina]